jgi:hypothetical protein
MRQVKLKKSASKISTDAGAAIRGEKVTAQFRKIGRVEVVHGSSTHKIQRAKLEGSVFCIIDRPLNYLHDIQDRD